ncbi:MAG: glycosyltransferase family 39 protein [Anaerolineae bacterium]|nr:glycosyltransferase family 39 protein [Anaerolineae bacterium]
MLYNDRQAPMLHIARKLTPKKEWFYTLALIVLAAIPRLCCLDLVEFKRDEANHYRMAYFLTRGHWRWTGSTASIGLPKPPLFVYILSLPLMVSNDPRVVTGFLGLLAALATGVFYLVLRRFLKGRAAFAAALLFALNPQAVMYGRKLFTADLLPPLCCLFLAAGVALLVSPRRHAGRLAILTAFTFALVILTTFSPLMLLPALVVLFLERRRNLRPAYWAGAGAALILPFVPYLIAVMPRRSAIMSIGTVSESSDSTRPILAWIWTLLQGVSWPANLLSVDGLVALVLAALSLAGLLFLLNQTRKRRGHWARFFLAWLLLSPLFALVTPFKIHSHYFVALYPLIFVLPAAGIELTARKANAAGWIALFLVIAIAIWNVHGLSGILQAAASGANWFGTPAGYWWRAAEQARSLAADRSATEVLLVLPDDQDGRLDALLSDTPHRVVDGQTTVVYPPHSAVLVIGPEVGTTLALTAPCTQDMASDLVASPFGGTYHYRLWEPAHADAALCTDVLLPADAQWASGIRLLGYGVSGASRPGETLHVVIHWETSQGPLNADVHWFNHLEDQESQRWGQLDLTGWPAERWQPGDRILMHFDLPIAVDAEPGPYILRIGQYIYHSSENLENIPVIDKAGNPADYAVTLPIPTD